MTIDELVTRLQAAQAARLDPLDYPRTWTERQANAYTTETRRIPQTISGLNNVPTDLDKPLRQLADLEAKRAAFLAKQAEIEQAIADAPDWRSFADGRDRDREYERQQNLRRQRQRLHEGSLFREPGVLYEPITYLDQRIVELTTRIEGLRANLDSLVQQAESLLGASVSG